MDALQHRVRAPRSGRAALALPLLLLGVSCMRPAAEPRPSGAWAYEVEAPARGSRVVTVQATFDDARTPQIAIAPDSAPFVRGLEVRTSAGWRTVERHGAGWAEPSCTTHCTIRYAIDLGQLAQACGDEVDCARRVGDATLSPALAWLAHPSPRTDVPVTVNVATPGDDGGFSSGLQPADDSGRRFAFRSYDLDEGSFTAFGPMRKMRVAVPSPRGEGEARVDVTMVGREPLAMSDEDVRAWVADSAGVMTPLFGKFPVQRSTLFVVPEKGEEEVVFGKVLSLAGASVVLVVGDRMKEAARRDDWVLVHEMFHLGFPTFRGEGRWLGEGLATYYEPILRARAGWMTADDVYRQFARNMPRGVPARGAATRSLAERDDLDSIYWGGALFCFAADVRIRAETRGKRSLDDVVRAALARGGDATKVWTVAEVIALGDEVTGTKVLSDMVVRHASGGERIDIEGLLASLGIAKDGVRARAAREEPPMAWVRRQILGQDARTLVAAKIP
ncbi:MAG: hypothetical protein JWP97_854 [Labilithrix sp.]|nr:hypothetical protein [Labilithrix sp.]